MLKLKRTKNTGPKEDNAQGISASGDALHRYWLIALLVVIATVAGSFAYLVLLREQSLQDAHIRHTAESLSRQQAAAVEQLLLRTEKRLESAALSPLALSAIASANPEDVTLVEKAMLDYFPSAVSLRLIPIGKLGTAGLEGSNLGLRNHIEVDLLRRTSDGENPRPESYQFDGVWLTSLAALVQHPRYQDKRAVILATLDNRVIGEILGLLDTSLGRSSLQQIYRKGNFTRADEIAAAGNGGASHFESDTTIYDGQWRLVFTPSAKLLSDLSISSTPLSITLALILVVSIGAFSAMLILVQRALRADVLRIGETAEKRSSLEIRFPLLLPLARHLRLTAMRNQNRPGLAGRPPPAGGLARQARRPADTLYQPKEMIEEDGETTDIVAPEKKPSAKPAASSANVPDHIFRAYDIRGIAGSELSEELVERIGKALGTLAGDAGQQAFVVGCDGRNSSPAIRNCLVKALLDSGRDVIDIGTVPTPLLYFATHTLASRSGVMVTGSHNPAEFNGLKITLDGQPFAGEDIQQLRERVIAGNFSKGAGRLAKQDVFPAYREAVLTDIAMAEPLRVVVDAGNGIAGRFAPSLLQDLGCEIIPLYCDIDGNFPNHPPDPTVDDNLKALQDMVVESGADLGIAFDGDADRVVAVTADGTIVRTDRLLMLFAQDIVSRNPGADVVFDVKCSRHLAQLISQFGGRPILWRTGHAFMRRKVIETGALLGGEYSGHIFFGERWFGFDDGIYAGARLIEIVSGSGMDLGSLLESYPQTESTSEILIPVPDEEKFALMSRIVNEGDFRPGKVNTIDGVRVDYNDGWGLVRASNTSPVLTARFEANDKDGLERIMTQFREQIALVNPDLDVGF
jgi:phosphomannomutase/phosphoglucomutase